MQYTERDLLRLAKRWNNARRSYLLVDPLQGKHLPVSPGAALEMMAALGDALRQARPGLGLVIGFAETATAVGAAVAARQGDCACIHTTREPFACAGDALSFREEHSHAADQWLCASRLGPWLEGGVALVDDEISTGRTLENIVRTLRARFPGLRERRVTAASILNRLSDERLAALSEQGIDCCWLLRLPLWDYTRAVERFDIRPAAPACPSDAPVAAMNAPRPLPDLRRGARIGEWMARAETMAAAVAEELAPALRGRDVLVLGTEECMLPGLLIGRALEGVAASARYHATTRSPIGICDDPDYPIRSGARLRSFYDPDRVTYIYNLAPCDAAVIVTDAPEGPARAAAIADLAGALRASGAGDIVMIQGVCDVQHL